MDTVYDVPFEAYIVVNPSICAKKVKLGPWVKNTSETICEDIIPYIEENDELDLYFISSAPDDKLYMDALECCPVTARISADDKGLVYCTPGIEPIKLYRSDNNYDALRVDFLQLYVSCNNQLYTSYLQVKPKQLSGDEWRMMRDDLENEIRGLTQDIVRRNIGLGDGHQGVLPPDDLYAFLLINKYAQAIMGALIDIQERPKYRIEKCYEDVDEFRNREIDTETVKRYLRRGNANNKLTVPRRNIVFDIQENRLLKKIIKYYDKRLDRFTKIINETLDYHKQQLESQFHHNLYEQKYIDGLEQYLTNAQKLKKVTSIIKNAEWFQEVSIPRDAFIPHSFAVDPRYGTLYRLYTDMNNKCFDIRLDPQYSYSWKKSSSLYEMWCYISICRYFLRFYNPINKQLEDIFSKDFLFPFLKSGTKITMVNENAEVEIIYDTVLPRSSHNIALYNNPFYITGKHNRPDICINIYSKKTGWYIGSVILECKYRKLYAILNGGTWSSREQINAYHNDSKSSLFFNGYFDDITSIRPVHKVIVLTPDKYGNREYPDNKVEYFTFKPTEDRRYTEKVCEQLRVEVDEHIKTAENFMNKWNNN